MKIFEFLEAFKRQNPDERIQLIFFKAGFYSFFVTVLLSFAAAFLFILRMESQIDFSDELFGLLLVVPWMAGSAIFTLYLFKNGIYKEQREEISRKPQAQRFKKLALMGGFFWMLLFTPAFMQLVFKKPWQENIGIAIFTACFYTMGMWWLQYRKVKNIEE